MATRKAKPRTTRKPAATAAAPAPAARDFAKAFRQEFRAPPPVPASNVIVLDADVAPHFQSSRAVNDALRALLRIVRQVREV